jgi:hypothetical protein
MADWDLEDDVRSALWHIHTRSEGRAWMARVLAAYELYSPLLHQAVATTEADSTERSAALAVSRDMLQRAQDVPDVLLYDIERLVAGDQRVWRPCRTPACATCR